MTRVFLASHSTPMTGPMDYLERYLLRAGHTVARLDHPLDTYAGRMTTYSANGQVLRRWRRRELGPISLVWDFIRTIFTSAGQRADVSIGANNFDTLSLLTARASGLSKTRKVIYFAADFSDERFPSRLMNHIYERVEMAALKGADVVVSNTARAVEKRTALGMSAAKSVLVPNGVLLPNATFKRKEIRKDHFVFVGSVTSEHGLYDLLKTLRPEIGRLTLIGQGTDWDRVVELCRTAQIPLQLFREASHEFVIDYLIKFEGIGLAPYNQEARWTYYCSPLKISEYIAAGIPVLTSSVPEIAHRIAADGLGIVYDRLDSKEIGSRLAALDTREFHVKAAKFYEEFNSDALYARIPL